MKRSLVGLSLICFGAASFLQSCKNNSGFVSNTTGWEYNDARLGGFPVENYPGQQTGPGLTFVEGGRFTMGQTEEDLTMEHNNIPRTVTVSSFYMDETEVSNLAYREYTYWLGRAYGSDYPLLVAKAYPDSTAWRKSLQYNEPRVKFYFSHAAFNYYPVVGVNWYQANEYAKWRSDRVNEQILIKNGMLKKNPNQINEDVFTDEAYTAGQYEGLGGRGKKRDLDPNGSKTRNTSYSDGYLLPDYRLPTEAEWEYAALGLIGNNPEPETKRRRGEEVVTDRNVYPWGTNHSTRWALRNEYQGEFLGNFQRGNGDAMGVAGALNDNADYTAPVYSYKPNAFGLYNMAGNVSEWTLDTYRPVTDVLDDHNPYRGNYYTKYVRLAEDNALEEKDSTGKLMQVPVTREDMATAFRDQDRGPDQRAFADGDSSSQVSYDFGKTTLVNNDAKVIKGASWADRAYWMSPGTRRYMPAEESSATVGFRCVMDRFGSANGDNGTPGGNTFGRNKR